MSSNLLASLALLLVVVAPPLGEFRQVRIVPASPQKDSGKETLSEQIDFDRGEVFHEVVSIVESHFYDKNRLDATWREQVPRLREKATRAATHDEFSAAINELLETLKTSHTRYFSTLEPKRYQLLGVFHALFEADRSDLFVYEGIGIDTVVENGTHHVNAVYDGLPGALAGLRFGDQLIAVDGEPFHPILSFADKGGRVVKIEIARSGKRLLLDATVESLDGRTMFERALQASIRVIEREGKKIGYLHAWSYAGSKYHEAISSEILYGSLSKCDALILDLRDGWGGASPAFLNLFRTPLFMLESIPRTGAPQNYSGTWDKPVGLLINGGTTSGKELFAYGFAKLKRGPIVGENTAGAVVAGQMFLLSQGDVLYLAVTDIRVDGRRLEGTGVAPDYDVPRERDSDANNDAQVESAVTRLVEALESSRKGSDRP